VNRPATFSEPSPGRDNGGNENACGNGLSRGVDFSGLARAYRWLEYLSFGPLLARCRLHFLPQLGAARRALILGDGDGRFAAEFLRANADALVDVVDSSEAMLLQVRRRIAAVPGGAARVTLHCCDALDFRPGGVELAGSGDGQRLKAYDLVVTHFFLDCFSTAELVGLVRRVGPHLSANALWVVSEFAVPPSGSSRLLRLAARSMIGGLYRVFGILTGLGVRQLPDYGEALRQAGFEIGERRTWLGGLLASELWRRSPRPEKALERD